jgi:hypothetical protein
MPAQTSDWTAKPSEGRMALGSDFENAVFKALSKAFFSL